MRLSIRQIRQVHNRNCAAAAGEHTVVSNLFEGQLSYMTLCMHCDHQAHSTQTFTVLSLPIPADTTKCSIQVTFNSCWSLLFPCHISDTSRPPFIIPCFFSPFRFYVVQDCLSLFFEQTILTGGEQTLCSVCGLRRETTVITCLDKPPEILALHLKRWVEM